MYSIFNQKKLASFRKSFFSSHDLLFPPLTFFMDKIKLMESRSSVINNFRCLKDTIMIYN